MKKTIRKRMIHDIPILEVVKAEHANDPLPLVIFYHGWRNNKELMLTQARKLADLDIRVILPDAMNHGERIVSDISKVPSLTFWTSIEYNIAEFDLIINYFNERQWIKDDKIGIGGYSMGGITTNALLTRRPEIKIAASLMGTPRLTYYAAMIRENARKWDYFVPRDLESLLSWIPHFDLDLHPEKIADRPFFLWHGTEDALIPYEQAAQFYEKIKEQPYAKNSVFLTGEGEGHLVTVELMETVADFFSKHFV